MASNVWNVLVEVDSEDKVPDRMFAGMQGGVLVNMVGRPPKCLRCLQRGHIKFHCTAPYCHKCREVGHEQSDDCRPTRSYASLVRRSEPADQDDMDDPAESNDVTMDHQLTTSQSWANQIDQVIKEICSWLPPFCKQNLLFIQPRWQLRTYFFNHYNVLF